MQLQGENYCVRGFQVATLLTCALLGSAMLFTYFCAIGWLWAASTQPPLMYGLLIFLFLPLPINFLFPVSTHGLPLRVVRGEHSLESRLGLEACNALMKSYVSIKWEIAHQWRLLPVLE